MRKYFQHDENILKTVSYLPFNPFLIYIPPPPISPRSTVPTNEEDIAVHLSNEVVVNPLPNHADQHHNRLFSLDSHHKQTNSSHQLCQIWVDNVKTESITDEHIHRIGRLIFDQINSAHFASFQASSPYNTYLRYKYIVDHTTANPEDFLLLRIVGRGGFGKVYAARHVFTGKLCAVKIMTKKRMKFHSSYHVCLDERKLLASVNSPYVLNLLFAFSTVDEVSLVCDLLTGGSLDYHINRSPFTAEQARYYAARTILALAALHKERIVYRDLKPQNIMLDSVGRSKLVDLGLASIVPPEGLVGRCGTRGYWAPEMLIRDEGGHRRHYGFTVDWFSLGCCIYEFMTGICLFYSEQVMRYNEDNGDKINPELAGSKDPPMGAHQHPDSGELNLIKQRRRHRAVDDAIAHMKVSIVAVQDPTAADLIDKLLIKNPNERLGFHGPEEVMGHPWFEGIDWNSLDSMDPPFTPGHEANVCLISEIGDFPDEDEVAKMELGEEDQKVFEGWEYVNHATFQRDLVEYLETQRSRVSFLYWLYLCIGHFIH